MARKHQFPPSVDPGLPHEPACPAGWERKSFGDLLSIVERPVKLGDEVEYQLVNAQRNRGGIVPRERLKGKQIRVKTQFEIKAGDFLISRRQIVHGACGIVPRSLDGAIVSNEYVTLRPKDGLLLDYLRHLPHTPYFQRTCFHSSVGVDVEKMIFKLESWLQFRIPVPPAWQQRKIATLLASVDEAIKKTDIVDCQLQDFKKTITRELLLRGLPGSCISLQEVPTGESPKGWEVHTLDKVAFIGTGSTPSKARQEYWHHGTIPWLPTGKVNDEVIVSADAFITEKALADSPLRLLPAGTVLVAMIGQGKTRGKTAYLAIDACVNQNFAYLIPTPKILSWYLYYYLESKYDELRGSGRGSNQDALNSKIVRAFPIALPPVKDQERIVTLLQSLRFRIEKERLAHEAMRKLKATLLQSLLSGEIRIQPGESAT